MNSSEGETQQHQFLWLDTETTGLDPYGGDTILELACALAEDDSGGSFDIVDAFERVCSGEVDGGQRRFKPAGAADWIDVHASVWQMHSTNGLWQDVQSDSAIPLAQLDTELDAWLREQGATKPRSVTLAGNSVHFDLRFVRALLPATAKLLHHRVHDVSTQLKTAELLGRPVPRVELVEHRALADVLQSLEYSRLCREAFGGFGE